MPLNIEALKHWVFEERRQSYSDKDSLLYALSVGFGADPLDAQELRYVYEKNQRAMPTMAATLCHLGPWIADAKTGASKSKVVHGEQRMRFHAPLPPAANLVARSRILGVQDKGADKGALVHVERAIANADTNEPLVTITHTSFCRADGGFGESFGPELALHSLPSRAPDRIDTLEIAADAALLYRLNVDRNPLHADPEVAQRAGFERPILHGLCTYGMVARKLLGQWLDYDASRMASVDARFSSVVFPGETLEIQSWRDGDVLSFKASVPARGKTVLDNGRMEIAP